MVVSEGRGTPQVNNQTQVDLTENCFWFQQKLVELFQDSNWEVPQGRTPGSWWGGEGGRFLQVRPLNSTQVVCFGGVSNNSAPGDSRVPVI